MKNSNLPSVNGKVFRSGLYSTAILAAAIVLAVLVNLVVRALPSKYTEFDLSAGQDVHAGRQLRCSWHRACSRM